MAKGIGKKMKTAYLLENKIDNNMRSSWDVCRLDELYTERKEPGEEGLPILSVSIHSGVSDGELDEDELGKKIKRIADKSQYHKAMAGDLVFNMMRAWQGAIGVVKTDGMVSPAYIVAKPSDKVYPLFMDYYMKTPRMIETIHRQSYGVTDFRLRLYWDSFAPIVCTLPPIAEQRKIAAILSTQDKVIDLYDRKIEQLKRFKKGVMGKLFPKPGCSTPEVRFPGFEGEWEKRKVSNVAEITTGGTPNTSIQNYWEPKEIPWLSSGEVHKKYIFYTDQDISTTGMNNSSARMVKENSVLIALAGQGKTRGTVAINRVPLTTNQSIAAITFHEDIVPEFVFYNLDSRYDEIRKMSSGDGARGGLNKQIVGDIEIPYTSEPEQRKIGNFFYDLDIFITLHQRRRDEEIRKKKALMQLLLTGIVRVKV